jgi:hypothetical protein
MPKRILGHQNPLDALQKSKRAFESAINGRVGLSGVSKNARSGSKRGNKAATKVPLNSVQTG